MPVTSQDINELLASGASPQDSLKNEIKKAEKYLKSGKGEKPVWLDDFFESNENKLKETILRAISSQEGITSLSGYNEGYFNEIIQNANDLHVGDSIDITVSKDNTVYSVECRYRDKGFILSNIYRFLNREMSDKSADEGQTGKFGVGIKSFFKFVRRFKIDSNIIFDFTINREQHSVESEVAVNEQWDKQNTTLYFEYDENEAAKSGFNISKLSELITLLDEDPIIFDEDEIRKFFISGEDDEIIFDIRSMIFMNKDPKRPSVTMISFSGTFHKVVIECQDFCESQEIESGDARWSIRNVGLDICLDDEEHEQCDYGYAVFKHASISLGIPLSIDSEDNDDNRFYSTYYIRSDTTNRLLPTGMIIDSPFANIHRNDLGDNEKAIDDAYQKISDAIILCFQCMCSPEITSVEYLDDISNAFHYILYKYLDADRESYEESPFNITGLDNQYLPKISGCTKSDIVEHKLEENYEKSTPLDADSVPALTALYLECIEKDNVIDYDDLRDSEECLKWVSMVYEQVASGDISDNYKIAMEILHYFSEVAEYITYKISGEYREEASLTDTEIDYWLSDLKEELGENYNPELCLKLIGRYHLNPALAFDGSLIKENLSFKDYLFNGIPELADGVLSNWQNQQYDSQYSELKLQMLGNRLYDRGNKRNKYKIRFIEPCSYSRRKWNGYYDCYELPYRVDFDVSENNKFILLEKIANNSKLLDSIDGRFKYLFEKCVIDWEYREKRYSDGKPFEYCYPDYEQQIIRLVFLHNIDLTDFGKFLEAVQYRKLIKDRGRSCPINISCHQSLLSTHDIVNIFLPHLVTLNVNERKSYLLSEYSPNDVIIEQVVENTNNELPQENRDFILRISGYRVHVSKFDSNSKKYVIAYFGNRSAKINLQSGSSFKPFAKYSSSSKDIYIFYDNVPDVNAVVSTVLKELDLSKYLMELLLGYIHNGNDTKTMNYLSRRRTFARVKKPLFLDWADFSSDVVSEIDDIEIIYRLLTARGSYDIYCPICADIPLETFDYGEDTKKKHSRRIVVLENENPETRNEYPYIITVACSYCFEKLRHTLSKSEFDGSRLKLTTQIAQGQHEKMKSHHQLELSPVNIMLMKKIKFRGSNT